MIEEFDYVPNLMAGSLAFNQTDMVAIVVPTIRNPVFSETVEAMSNIFRSVGFEIPLGTAGQPPGDESRLIENLLARRHGPASQGEDRSTPKEIDQTQLGGLLQAVVLMPWPFIAWAVPGPLARRDRTGARPLWCALPQKDQRDPDLQADR